MTSLGKVTELGAAMAGAVFLGGIIGELVAEFTFSGIAGTVSGLLVAVLFIVVILKSFQQMS